MAPRKKLTDDTQVSTETKTTRKKTKSESEGKESSASTTRKPRKTTKKNEVLISGGDSSCYVYFDMKFINDDFNSDILSLALIDYTGNCFYAEFNDFDAKKVSKNHMNLIEGLMCPQTSIIKEHLYIIRSDRNNIRLEVLKWLEAVSEGKNTIQIVCDNNPLGFIRFLEFINDGKPMNELPENISKFPYDINQDIATSISRPNNSGKSDKEFNENYVPVVVASEVDRFEFIKSFKDFEYQHNMNTSLFKAMTTMIIHQYIWGF